MKLRNKKWNKKKNMELNKQIFTIQECPTSSACGGCNSCQGTTTPHGSDYVDCGNCLDHNINVLRYENDNKMHACEYQEWMKNYMLIQKHEKKHKKE